MTLGEFRRLTRDLPNNYELIEADDSRYVDDIDIDDDLEEIYLYLGE